MEKEEIFYQAKASYVGESIYETKRTKTVLSPKFKSIEDLSGWIIDHKRTTIIFGMGDISYPAMSSCKIIKNKIVKNESQLDLKAFFHEN